MSTLAALGLALKGMIRGLLGGPPGHEALLASAIARLEAAGRQLRLHLADLAMTLGRTHRKLGEASPDDPLHAQLSSHASAMLMRLGQLRLQLADLDGKVLQLKALQADLRLHADLKAVRGRLQHILGDLVPPSTDPLAELTADLDYHEDIRATLSELRRGGLLR